MWDWGSREGFRGAPKEGGLGCPAPPSNGNGGSSDISLAPGSPGRHWAWLSPDTGVTEGDCTLPAGGRVTRSAPSAGAGLPPSQELQGRRAQIPREISLLPGGLCAAHHPNNKIRNEPAQEAPLWVDTVHHCWASPSAVAQLSKLAMGGAGGGVKGAELDGDVTSDSKEKRTLLQGEGPHSEPAAPLL